MFHLNCQIFNLKYIHPLCPTFLLPVLCNCWSLFLSERKNTWFAQQLSENTHLLGFVHTCSLVPLIWTKGKQIHSLIHWTILVSYHPTSLGFMDSWGKSKQTFFWLNDSKSRTTQVHLKASFFFSSGHIGLRIHIN